MDPRAILVVIVVGLTVIAGQEVTKGVKHAAHKIVHVLKKGDK